MPRPGHAVPHLVPRYGTENEGFQRSWDGSSLHPSAARLRYLGNGRLCRPLSEGEALFLSARCGLNDLSLALLLLLSNLSLKLLNLNFEITREFCDAPMNMYKIRPYR